MNRTRPHKGSEAVPCAACHVPRSPGELISLSVVRPTVASQVRAAHPDVLPGDQVCLSCLNSAISDEIDLAIQQDQSDFAALNEEALLRLSQQEAVTRNLNDEEDRSKPF